MSRRIHRLAGRSQGFTPPASSRTENGLLVAAFFVVTLMLVMIATQGSMLLTVLAVGAAGYTAVLVTLGATRTAVLTLMAAFATAPMYKGLAPSPESLITPTDLLFVLGFGLLLPSILGNRLRLPMVYVLGLAIVLVTGCVGAIVSVETTSAFLALVLWLMVMGGLPTMFALWQPSPVVIRLLLSSYVAGHMVSTADAFLEGAAVQGRYAGLTTHFNLFAQAGMLSFAILLFLFSQCRSSWVKLVVLGAALISVYTVHMSGSRAALLVVAVLILMIPVVERSAIIGFAWALLGVLVIVALPLLVNIAGENSALGRLTGGGGSQYSSQEREMGREEGISRFFDHPLTGSGLVDLFHIHNNYLEVAVGLGVVGLVGYLLVLYTLARPLFGSDPQRRLGYAVWAYIGFGATVPGLYDRSMWAPVSLAILAALGSLHHAHSAPPGSGGAEPAVPPHAAPDREAIR